MTEQAFVRVMIEERVGVITIDHPPVNALDEATFVSLEGAFDRLLADEQVKVVVITGSGDSFVAGADIRTLADMSGAEDAKRLALRGQKLCTKIERSLKPVIAAINGRYCLGGGCELALACHMRIAEARVKMGQPEIKLGLIPGWGASQRLPRLIGVGKAVELILSGDHLRAQEALRLGLINHVVPEGEALEQAMRLAHRLSALSSVAMACALDCIYTGLDQSIQAGLAHEASRFAEMAETKDMREGLSAFLEKRSPAFEDR